MAIVNRLDGVQRAIEERRQVVLLATGDDPGHDLIEMQVGEAQRRLLPREGRFRFVLEEDAGERH